MKTILLIIVVFQMVIFAGTLHDPRTGKTYKTVKIGQQEWMAENLYVKESVEEDDEDEEDVSENICPEGWKIPTIRDLAELTKFVGGEKVVCKKLKSKNGWRKKKGGTDDYGFSLQPDSVFLDYCDEGCDEEVGDNMVYIGNMAIFFHAGCEEDDEVLDQSGDDLCLGPYNFTCFEERQQSPWNWNTKVVGPQEIRCLRDSDEGSGGSSQRTQAQPSSATMTDSRDGKTYKTVKIGDQTWMAENLNYKTGNSWCYDNNSSNCNKYGRLYDWNMARSACPSGWHLPSDDEWNTLWTAVGGTNTAGTKLKSKNGWNSNGNGTDSFGFAVLPAGGRRSGGSFSIEGDLAGFWSSTEDDSGFAYFWNFYYDSGNVGRNYNDKDYGFSVRCLRNSNE